MIKLNKPRWLFRALTLVSGVSMCLLPAAVSALPGSMQIIPAVSAPSPLSQTTDLTALYHQRMELLRSFPLTHEQRLVVLARMDESLQSRLLAGEVTQAELDYLSLPYYQADHAPRYQAYAQENPLLTAPQVVTFVNMELDLTFYYQPETITDPDSTAVLVNKHFALSSEYAPEVEVLGTQYGAGSLRSEAAIAFRAMADQARSEGISLRSVSSYRSYRTQEILYSSYLARSPQSVVDDFSARPGHSEHQTGLALDINTASSSAHFENTAEFAWLQANCARFGFILRYPEGKESITGYRFEPWHYRYVGTEIASVCMEQNLTYEEYIARRNADALGHIPTLCSGGRFLPTQKSVVALNGTCYFSAEALATHLDWSASEMIAGESLLLYSGDGQRLTLLPGMRYYRDERVFPLSSPALELDGTLYLTLEDLSQVLGFRVQETDAGLELISPQ